MKGIVFSEFSEMVEEVFSPEMLDQIIEQADLPSQGAYTAVGTYDHAEIISLVQHLSAATDTPADVLVKAFGRHLAGRFSTLYPGFFEGVEGTFEFLETIENHVHAEVRKLYPDAELPAFEASSQGERLTLLYQSRRPFADLAEGLILGCSEHFGETVEIVRRDLDGDGLHRTEFRLRKAE
jgi:hypothetical protein